MLISLSGLASISTILSSEQVGLLLSFLNQERSSHIRETALRCLKFLVTRGQCYYPVNSDLIRGLFCMLEEPEVSIAIQCEVLQVLHKVHLCFPPSLPYMEVHEFVKLLTVAENAIQHTDLMKSHLAIHILADLSCRFLGGTVSVIHHCSHGNFTVDKSYNFLQALVMQDFIGRLWHVDHETKTKFSLLLNFIDQPTICFHLQPRYQTCNIGFEYREFLNVCRDAISGVVHFQDELRKDHNEKAPSEVTKNGLLLILNTITKWIYIPSRIPKYFFQVRQIVGSELFVNSDHTRNGVGISVFPSFNLSLNLCLQLKNLPPDFHVQLAKLYCILYCPVSCQVPSPSGQTLEQPSSVYEAWKDDEIVELNKKLFCHVSDCMTCKGRSGKHGRDDGNNKAVEAFLHFESNQKGQGFSNCILDVSDFPVGSYRIKWHSCMVDSRGSFWSLLPLNMGPVFTIQNL